uniref:Gag polyprotein n=1 Tax=Lygus hesperus TaxID=30085 RepID=A0A0A9WFM1_LYGHE
MDENLTLIYSEKANQREGPALLENESNSTQNTTWGMENVVGGGMDTASLNKDNGERALEKGESSTSQKDISLQEMVGKMRRDLMAVVISSTEELKRMFIERTNELVEDFKAELDKITSTIAENETGIVKENSNLLVTPLDDSTRDGRTRERLLNENCRERSLGIAPRRASVANTNTVEEYALEKETKEKARKRDWRDSECKDLKTNEVEIKIRSKEGRDCDNAMVGNNWRAVGTKRRMLQPTHLDTCYSCGDNGHFASSCPNRGKKKCYLCKKITTHLAADCPENDRRERHYEEKGNETEKGYNRLRKTEKDVRFRKLSNEVGNKIKTQRQRMGQANMQMFDDQSTLDLSEDEDDQMVCIQMNSDSDSDESMAHVANVEEQEMERHHPRRMMDSAYVSHDGRRT